MQLADHDKRSKKKCKLSQSELDTLIAYFEEQNPTDYPALFATKLMALCGLRSNEAVAISLNDIERLDDDSGFKLRIPTDVGKEGTRETFMPEELKEELDMYVSMNDDIGPNDPIVGVTTRTLRRWIDGATDDIAEQTGNDSWLNATAHDMRRTWGNLCIEAGMVPTVVQQQGGWETWEVFEENYLTSHSDSVVGQESRKLFG